MKCPEREKIFTFAHRMLSSGEEAEVNRHLEACAACRETAREYARVDAVLDEWKAAEPTPTFDARVRSAALTAQVRSALRFGWAAALAPAMVLIVILVSVVVIHNRHAATPKNPAPAVTASTPHPAPPAQIETPDEQAQSELTMYQNLSLLEDYDMLRDFDVLSEMPKGGKKVDN